MGRCIPSVTSDHIPNLPASNFLHTLQFSLHSYLMCRHNILCTGNVYCYTYTSNLHVHYVQVLFLLYTIFLRNNFFHPFTTEISCSKYNSSDCPISKHSVPYRHRSHVKNPYKSNTQCNTTAPHSDNRRYH